MSEKTTPACKLKAALKIGVGFSALFAAFAAPSYAQETEAAEDGTRRLNTIKVEATRREGVTVQDVPVAVTAFDSAILDDTGFKNLQDLEQIAPSVGITQTESATSGTSISIRGIGTGSNNPGFEPAVGAVIDGVFRTRTGVALAELPELSSVEVLRGPQGTLFGRNTSAGVVSINTKKPTQEGERVVGVTFSNYDGFAGEFSATGGISDNWSARLDGKVRNRDGYILDENSDRDFNDINRYSLRGQLLFEGLDSELRLIGDFAKTDEQCCVAGTVVPGSTDAAVNAAASLFGGVGVYSGDLFDYRVSVSPNRDFDDSVEEWGVSAQWDKDLEIGKLTSITAYRDWEASRNQDIDFSGIDRAYRDGYEISDTVFTQELRLQGQRGNIDWLVGGFYMYEDLELNETILFGTQADFYVDALYNAAFLAGTQDPTSPFFGLDALFPNGVQVHGSLGPAAAVPSFLILSNPTNPALAAQFIPGTQDGFGSRDTFNVETNAIALFTHNEISLSDPLTLTLGLRYNYETKDIDETLAAVAPGCDFLNTPAGAATIPFLGAIAGAVCNPAVNTEHNGQLSGDRSDNELTGTVKLSYDFNNDLMVYGSYSRGFKSGGYNLARSAFDGTAFGGDGAQITDQEFDPELVDAFELGWKSAWWDGRLTANGAIFFQQVDGFQENIFTGINFRTFNVDVESKGVELDLGANPIDGLLLQGGIVYQDVARQSDILVPDGTGGFVAVAEEGVQLSNTPEWVITGAGTYSFPISDYLDAIAHVNFRYNDEAAVVAQPDLRAALTNDAYTLVGARFGVIGNDGQWELSVFGENLTEEEYFLSGFVVPEQTRVAAYPGTPRFYGVEGKFRF